MARRNRLNTQPKVVAELGPGDSLGLAALISGSERYYAFDIVRYASCGLNFTIFHDLVRLFQCRAAIPGEDEFLNLSPPFKLRVSRPNT
jgi:CRP-like cAMP-binding protein